MFLSGIGGIYAVRAWVRRRPVAMSVALRNKTATASSSTISTMDPAINIAAFPISLPMHIA